MSKRICSECSGPLPPHRRTLCSDECRTISARRRAREWYEAHRGEPDLVARVAASSRRHREKRVATPDGRAAQLEATKRWREANPDRLRETERRWRIENAERVRQKNQRRRARLLAAFVEDVDPEVVWQRDQGACGLCLDPIDPNLPWPDKFSKTIDHIVPLSRGGTHEYANVQLAHHVCNARKNNF